MSYQVKSTCTRCGRGATHDILKAVDADALSERPVVRAATAQKIIDFLGTFEPNDLPAAMAFTVKKNAEGKFDIETVSQAVLCDPKTDKENSRSCVKAAAASVGELVSLPPRAKKVKEPKAAEAEGSTAPAATEAAAAPAPEAAPAAAPSAS